ncbi:uncharacterized protein BO66DRAFT_172018 [Aspergillus aculeatinus CBS 121060]|uniref:Uncharacterized protein n=1 Tax=Aspergillus aculeatinus CBS 121060 TaxID=1448322 RepID=A0ACD1GYX0_9EURO|nr:hypothetical protein BO66DRAFT_172018 [Aspergillus aculeatinus CBS 121060]RAH66551.1 hypothetical protein BO66DRAFT_172018 [Aspergillus aculeatinus CBS 121060]
MDLKLGKRKRGGWWRGGRGKRREARERERAWRKKDGGEVCALVEWNDPVKQYSRAPSSTLTAYCSEPLMRLPFLNTPIRHLEVVQVPTSFCLSHPGSHLET